MDNLNFRYNVGDEVHSTLYNANGVISLCSLNTDKNGTDECYEVHFRVNDSIVVAWIEVAMLKDGFNYALES